MLEELLEACRRPSEADIQSINPEINRQMSARRRELDERFTKQAIADFGKRGYQDPYSEGAQKAYKADKLTGSRTAEVGMLILKNALVRELTNTEFLRNFIAARICSDGHGAADFD